MKIYLFLIAVVLLGGCAAPVQTIPEYTPVKPSITNLQRGNVDSVIVEKSKNRMYLMDGNRVVKSYHVALGKNPVGHKVKEGDHRTPEGVYMLNYKNTKSQFYKSINIDYPNENDLARAAMRGVDAGDDIVIHGLPNKLGNYQGNLTPKNWTQGCIGVRNHEMDEIWSLVALDTPIDIRP